jgi:hypothetical protein
LALGAACGAFGLIFEIAVIRIYPSQNNPA